MALPKIYDWPKVRADLKRLSDRFPGDFESWQLIGGAACWFYRAYLERADDPDFRVPKYSPADEQVWMSKDMDFMGLSSDEAAQFFGQSFKPETHTISLDGMEIDFLDEGLKLDANDVANTAREVRTSEFIFYVAEATLLYDEKFTLTRLKNRPQDRLHCELLAELLKFEFCRDAENPEGVFPTKWLGRARAVKTTNLNFFADDERLLRRLGPAIRALNIPHLRGLKHWAKHHLPGYTD